MTAPKINLQNQLRETELKDKYIIGNKNADKSNLKLHSLKKKEKKTNTPVRIEDDVLNAFKDYCLKNNLVSHGLVINEILKNFLIDNGYNI